MANVNWVTIWSDDNKKFDEITKDLTFEGARSIEREPGRIITRISCYGDPAGVLEKMSKDNPDMLFYMEYAPESELFETVTTVRFREGNGEKIKEGQNGYDIHVENWMREQVPTFEKLQNKLISACRRLDTIDYELPEDEQNLGTVLATITVEADGFRMQAHKDVNTISDIRLFKGREVTVTKWDEMQNDDIPF